MTYGSTVYVNGMGRRRTYCDLVSEGCLGVDVDCYLRSERFTTLCGEIPTAAVPESSVTRFEAGPGHLLLQAILLPVVDRLWEQRKVANKREMRDDHENVRVSVEGQQLLQSLPRCRWVLVRATVRNVKHGHCALLARSNGWEGPCTPKCSPEMALRAAARIWLGHAMVWCSDADGRKCPG